MTRDHERAESAEQEKSMRAADPSGSLQLQDLRASNEAAPRARRQSKDPLERYDTPIWVTRALLEHYSFMLNMDVLEPCAGAGMISNVLRDEGSCDVLSYDIAPRAPGIFQADTLLPDFWRTADVGGRILCTNPPFSLAAPLIRYGLKYHARAVVMLLRLTWLEATADRFDIPSPSGLIVVPRPKFAGPGSESCTVAWMIWQRHLPNVGIVRVSRAEKAILERGRPQSLIERGSPS